MSEPASPLPLVYSCSGCSSAAQLANHVALRLDRSSIAEMSCIAGIGGDVPSLLKTARSGRPIIALDGCPLVCVKAAWRATASIPTVITNCSSTVSKSASMKNLPRRRPLWCLSR